MARTEIHPISTTLNAAIDYITNPEKTNDYVLCSTFECTLQCAAIDFEDEFLKGTGRATVLAQHIIQSFAPGEISPEEAHKVGRELCDKFLKGNYQYVIATHIDKKHIHNHIIFNNVNMDNHKTFETIENRGAKIFERLQKISDEICEEHGLSVIKNPEQGISKSYYEWQQDKAGNSWKTLLRNAIDDAVKNSADYTEFLRNMQGKGYEYKDQKYLGFRLVHQGQERYTRCKASTLGWYYVREQIIKRIDRYNSLKSGTIYTRKTNIVDTNQSRIIESAAFQHWAMIHNMQEASKLINLLTEKGISSPEQLEEKLMDLHGERLKLADDLNNIQDKINSKSEVVKLLEVYRKFKPLYSQYKEVREKEKFRRTHIKEISMYEATLRKLKEMYPEGKIPNYESEKRELNNMIDERNIKNKEYNSIRSELSKLETARKAVEEYMNTIDRSSDQVRKKEDTTL